jgi:hypothetical protein
LKIPLKKKHHLNRNIKVNNKLSCRGHQFVSNSIPL